MPGTHCVVGWVGNRAGLDGCRKSSPPLGLDPRTVRPVASRYTDWAVATPTWQTYWVLFCTELVGKYYWVQPWELQTSWVSRIFWAVQKKWGWEFWNETSIHPAPSIRYPIFVMWLTCTYLRKTTWKINGCHELTPRIPSQRNVSIYRSTAVHTVRALARSITHAD